MDQVTVPCATVEQVLGALEGGADSWRLIGPAIDALRAALEQTEQEPFGYFRAEPCGWTDCSETDEGAKPLYEKPPTTWTPATTPPDTERTVLAWVNGEWFSAWYYARDRQWMDACVGATIENVTHWMDPTPPTTTTQPEPK